MDANTDVNMGWFMVFRRTKQQLGYFSRDSHRDVNTFQIFLRLPPMLFGEILEIIQPAFVSTLTLRTRVTL